MRLEVGVDLIKEGLVVVIFEGVEGRIGKLFEGFGLVVRVIHDYRS